MEKLITYIKHSRTELGKVIFPTKDQIKRAFVSVFVVVTVISLFLALIDFTMSKLLSQII